MSESLLDLIPEIKGLVYEYMHGVFFQPDSLDFVTPDHSLIRKGLRVFDVLEYNSHQAAFLVRPFRTHLKDEELRALADG